MSKSPCHSPPQKKQKRCISDDEGEICRNNTISSEDKIEYYRQTKDVLNDSDLHDAESTKSNKASYKDIVYTNPPTSSTTKMPAVAEDDIAVYLGNVLQEIAPPQSSEPIYSLDT